MDSSLGSRKWRCTQAYLSLTPGCFHSPLPTASSSQERLLNDCSLASRPSSILQIVLRLVGSPSFLFSVSEGSRNPVPFRPAPLGCLSKVLLGPGLSSETQVTQSHCATLVSPSPAHHASWISFPTMPTQRNRSSSISLCLLGAAGLSDCTGGSGFSLPTCISAPLPASQPASQGVQPPPRLLGASPAPPRKTLEPHSQQQFVTKCCN